MNETRRNDGVRLDRLNGDGKKKVEEEEDLDDI